MNTETIAAVCSGLTCSGISVIRISGDEAFTVADRVFRSKSGRSVAEMKSYTVAYGHIVSDGKVLDEVLLIKMKAPKTYTREDVVEIDCHGGIVVTKAVLETIIKAGARPAEPGEFTKRAFLNGRIDLSQAEAVSDIISAKSTLALKNSINQLGGDVKNKIASLRDRLLSKTAFIEAALDDPEHYSLEGFPEELEVIVNNIRGEIDRLISSYDNGRIIREGVSTVILGRPNAGKSSLLNVLLGEERAIVTDIAGTTRDTLEESVVLDGVVLNMIDTAGIRDTGNIIEQIGVDKARKAAADADLILYVIDAGEGLTEDDAELLSSVADKKVIILLNKTDLESGIDADGLREELEKSGFTCNSSNGFSDESVGSDNRDLIAISTLTGAGIDELKSAVTHMFFKGQLNFNDEIYITNVRQKSLLADARNSLTNVLNSIEAGMPEDFLSIDLMAAYTSLGLITGDNVEDDLADRIFSEFCMGK